MKIGIGLPNPVPHFPGTLIPTWAAAAERRGFTTLATIDRVAFPNHDSLISLAAAAAAREISESWFGNATRSMVASVVNPRRSAAAAHVGIRVPGKWGTGLGKPMPIFMNVNLLVKDPAGKATTVELQ